MKRTPRGQKGGSHGTVWRGPAQVLPARKRSGLGVKDIECPSCGAEPGEECVNLGLKVASDKGKPCFPHRARRRLAIRVDNEERERAGDLKPREPWERKPGVLEVEDGAPCPVCRLKIKVTLEGRIASHTARGGKYITPDHPRCAGSGTKVSDEVS